MESTGRAQQIGDDLPSDDKDSLVCVSGGSGSNDESNSDGLSVEDSPWKACPVCRTLPLEELLNDAIPRSEEFTLPIESFDWEEVAEYFYQQSEEKCGLCELVLELGAFWSGKSNNLWESDTQSVDGGDAWVPTREREETYSVWGPATENEESNAERIPSEEFEESGGNRASSIELEDCSFVSCHRYSSSLSEPRSEFQISCDHGIVFRMLICQNAALTCFLYQDSQLAGRISSRVVHEDPLSGYTLARMQQWVTNCDETHTTCKSRPTRLPTRVLDVQDLQRIILCETANNEGQYLTLSHCWGSSKSFLTTPSTRLAMETGFEVDDLPATFRDAVLVTKAFGQRYLWIDSLCIIQGDSGDWASESAKMGDIYANSYFTIAALDAEDDSEGFLQREFRFTALDITSTNGQSTRVYLETNQCPTIRSEPLRTRAWTLQEEYLSQRILSFSRYEATWKCSHGVVNETGIPDLIHPDARINVPVQNLQPVPYDGHLSYESWYLMITRFSGRALTFDTDRLPSLAGLASRIASIENGQYCAGLWWDDILFGLLWRRARLSQSPRRPTEYIAPSWSWASVNGRIETLDSNHVIARIGLKQLPPVSFDNYHLETVTSNSFGQLREGGWLTLTAPLIPLGVIEVLREEHPHASFAIANAEETKRTPILDADDLDFPDEEIGEIYALVLAYELNLYDTVHHIGQVDFKSDAGLENRRRIWGILVRKIDLSSNNYERVGCLEVYNSLQIVKDQPVVSITLY